MRELFVNLVGGNPVLFKGVQLSDLPDMEKKMELNINVFELKQEEDGSVVGQIIQRSHHSYPDIMNLKLV